MTLSDHFRSRKLLVLSSLLLAGCGGGGSSASTTTPQVSAPVVTTQSALNGAVVVTLTTTTTGATIYYTLDGSTPTATSSVYEAPFLVAADGTLKAIATAGGETASGVTSKVFSLGIPSGTLVWSDEFDDTTGANVQPNPAVWTYDTGGGGWGNSELETYCGWNASVSPCSSTSPNVYVGTDGYLHIVAQQLSPGVYTSARLKTQGLFSFQNGRLEVRAQIPEEQGLWPAIWLLGNNIATVNWPACGEQDVMEHVNAATTPDWIAGSIHGTGFTGANLGTTYHFGSGDSASAWHTYGMKWSKGSVSYYVDNPSAPYATYTTSSINGLSGSVWPFDAGANFILINMAVGGTWPGSPNTGTVFPAQMLVDYVRIYTN